MQLHYSSRSFENTYNRINNTIHNTLFKEKNRLSQTVFEPNRILNFSTFIEMYKEVIKLGLILIPMEELPTFVERMQVSSGVEFFYQKNKSGVSFDDAMKSE